MYRVVWAWRGLRCWSVADEYGRELRDTTGHVRCFATAEQAGRLCEQLNARVERLAARLENLPPYCNAVVWGFQVTRRGARFQPGVLVRRDMTATEAAFHIVSYPHRHENHRVRVVEVYKPGQLGVAS